MKKHNEGYVLPYVLVVMAVLGLVAASVFSFSVKNLQTQQRTIERMQDKYKAQGAVEIIVSQLDQEFTPVEYKTDVEDITEAVKTTIDSQIQKLCENVYPAVEIENQSEEAGASTTETSPGATGGTTSKTGSLEYEFELESVYHTVKIVCTLKLSVDYKYTTPKSSDTDVAASSDDPPALNSILEITPKSVAYKSYEISSVTPSDEHSVAMPMETTAGGVT